MSADTHFDGGHLRRSSKMHRDVIEHDDGQVSAIVIRGVPALECDLCEEAYYESGVTDAVVALLKETEVGPGEAVAVEYRAADAAQNDPKPPDSRPTSISPRWVDHPFDTWRLSQGGLRDARCGWRRLRSVEDG